MTEILGTVHPSAHTKELTMHQKLDVSVFRWKKEREEPILMDLPETAKHNPSPAIDTISLKCAHQHGFSPFINWTMHILPLKHCESFRCHQWTVSKMSVIPMAIYHHSWISDIPVIEITTLSLQTQIKGKINSMDFLPVLSSQWTGYNVLTRIQFSYLFLSIIFYLFRYPLKVFSIISLLHNVTSY